MKVFARGSMLLVTVLITLSVVAQARDAVQLAPSPDGARASLEDRVTRETDREAKFVVITYDLTKNEVVKAEVRQDSVRYPDDLTPQVSSRAVFLVPGGGTPVSQVAMQRQSTATEIQLLTPAPTFDAEAVVFQGVSPGAVLIRSEAFWAAMTLDGERPRIGDECEGTTITYRDSTDTFLTKTTCVQLSQTLDGEATFPDGSGRKLRSYTYCYMCWNCWSAFGKDFCDPPYETCGSCSGQVGYIPRG